MCEKRDQYHQILTLKSLKKITLSLVTPGLGKETTTPPNWSPIWRKTSPRLATKNRWCLGSTVIVSSTILSRSLILASSSFLAELTASFDPKIVITSRSSSFSLGKIIRAPVLSLTLRILTPLKMKIVWNCPYFNQKETNLVVQSKICDVQVWPEWQLERCLVGVLGSNLIAFSWPFPRPLLDREW